MRRAVDLGVRLIDTADAYGPYITEELVAEAPHPYPPDRVISTKGGLTRQGPDCWHAVAPRLRMDRLAVSSDPRTGTLGGEVHEEARPA
ncbi:aldo/keto reductase [Kitasatospora sp. NPDC059673]|uniref:aldo/keto reductase n=1 Tax=Kitasatospora sp. NPDC059673 TaxID=3346901 RepID=UPI0036B68A28